MRLIDFIKYVFVISTVLSITSCKILKKENKNDEPIVAFPSSPKIAKIQFLKSIGSSFDIEKKQSKFSKFVIGEDKPKNIINPFGVAMRFNKIYVCDIGLKAIEIIDLQKQTFEYFIPEGKGRLTIPVNCYVDEKGYLYVADSGRKQIVIFDAEQKFIGAFGDSINFKPLDVFVSDNKIWVANYSDHKINVYKNDSTRKFLFSFPEAESGDDAFLYQPKDLSVTNEKVFVSDFGGFNIKVYSKKDGKYIKTIGSQGMYPGQFARPKGIAVDNDENLYAIDAAFGNIQIFNKESQLLLFFGNPNKGRGYMNMPACVDINYENLIYFEKFVDEGYDLKYLILVTNQYGPYKLNIYGRVEPKKK